ncbi:hypothetical protein [Sorangium cellulosum]|nr:hypothetical protein [Sorangium cellulosum]
MAFTHRPRASRLPFASPPLAASSALLALAGAVALGACGEEFTARPPDTSTSSSSGGGGGSGGGGSGGAGGAGGGCPDGGASCGGDCVDTSTDTRHCGACDNVCSRSGGTPSCVDGACQPPACDERRGDCDQDPSNGCEEDLRTSVAHCGACGQPCSGQCVQGACVVPEQISAGADYTCAVLSDKTVWCWGRNTWGNLGDGSLQQDRPIPRQVVGLDGPAARVAAGLSSARTHTCAVMADGGVACWGAGNSGQLGDGSAMSSLSPVRAEELTGVRWVAVGAAHTCAVTRTHDLYCWGEGGSGQLGYGGHDDQVVPLVMADGVEMVTAGVAHTCAALREQMGERRMSCWGDNTNGQLGISSFVPQSTPTPLMGLTDVATAAAGSLHTCAAPRTGVASCWGKGDHYRLGTGIVSSEPMPRRIPELVDVTQLALGARHSGAVLAGGAALTWGDNTKGQLGNGTQDLGLTPQPIALTGVKELALGDDHSCALTTKGEMYCWGDNTNGQLGDGTTDPQLLPARVRWPARP